MADRASAHRQPSSFDRAGHRRDPVPGRAGPGSGAGPDLITPANYQAEQTKAHPVGPGEFEPDLAWPVYPFRQAPLDLGRVGGDLSGRYGRLAKWPVDVFFRGRHGSRVLWWLFFPIPLITLYWLLVTGLTALACFAVFAAVNIACMALAGGAHGALAGLARGGSGLGGSACT